MKTAVIYARYSSERQTEQSIEGQVRECTEYAKYHDILIVDTYIDRAMTGTNDNRTSFQKMLKDASKQAWDIVLVYKLDRFSRNKYEMAIHRKTLRDNGIRLVSAKENIPDSPEGIILESLLEGMAEYYSAELSQKVRRGMRESRLKGNFTGGHLLYGYKVENKKVVIDETKALIVRRIFNEYASGKFVKNIVSDLTKEGFYNKNKPFAINTIINMLKNKKYIGINEHDDEVFNNTYPRIVSQEVFDIVSQTFKQNRYGKRTQEVFYLLKNKLFCGYCGKQISSESGTSKTGKVIRYYKCSNRKKSNKCCKESIRKEVLEELVLDVTLKTFENKTKVNYLAEKILELNNANNNSNSKTTLLENEKTKITKSIENILTAIENGIVTSSTKERLEDLELNLKVINESILYEKSRERIKLQKEDIIKFIKKAIKKEPRLLVKTLVKKIILFDDKIEIYYNYIENRKRPDEEDHQAFSFFSETFNVNVGYLNYAKPTNTINITVILLI